MTYNRMWSARKIVIFSMIILVATVVFIIAPTKKKDADVSRNSNYDREGSKR